jgi:hypothetical protein
MRSKRGAYVAAVVGLVVGTLALWGREGTGQAQRPRPPVVWEYKVLDWAGGDPTPSLNELGTQGWELATSRGYGDEYRSHTLYVFKRAKP